MRKPPSRTAADAKTRIRCGVYTRKSSEEGLEQEFNSLDAQRESCEAFIKSQKHEGWLCLPEMYDDGGISGGTMDRPALKRLLADIEMGRIDAVVVYKVDRLTRSLNDFAKIVEVFDRQKVSFISVTQQFNTTTSMGRLTLNMLLSFAQFEREVTGERIRDKIAASKAKGMWMGGNPPLGYDTHDKKLVVNPQEAETVRSIFRRYLALCSVTELKYELEKNGIRSKVRIDKFNRQTGGHPLARGALYLMLQNPIYRGLIVHKDKIYPGEHTPIIDDALWNDVQRILATNRVDQITGARGGSRSLLAGLVYDESGERMIPTHAKKRGTRYRYYVSKGLITDRRSHTPNGRRVPAGELETLVEDRLRLFFGSQSEVYGAVESEITDASACQNIVTSAATLAQRWLQLTPPEKRSVLMAFVGRITLRRETLEIEVLPGRLPCVLNEQSDSPKSRPARGEGENAIVLTVAARLKRMGTETKLHIQSTELNARKKADHSLHRLLARSHQYNAMVMQCRGQSIAKLAAEAGVSAAYFSRVFRLTFLAPDVLQALLRDRHPLELTAKRLANETQLPASWEAQRALLGLTG